VEVFLGGLDLHVAHAFHDGFEVGSFGEEPGGVGVAEVVHANREVDPAGFGSPVGECCLDTSMMISSTVTVLVRKSMYRGRRAMSSPHRMPVSIAVSTSSRYRSGIAVMRSSYSAGVRVRLFLVMTLGSSGRSRRSGQTPQAAPPR
jgi:hypothetical protein